MSLRSLLAGGVLLCLAGGCREIDRSPGESAEPGTAPDEEVVTPGAGLLADLPPPAVETGGPEAASGSGVSFRDEARNLGVQFEFVNQVERGRRLMPEATAGPGGWFDYDGDGRPDLYLAQGGDPAAAGKSAGPADHLYRNPADGRFVEVLSEARVPPTGYAHGLASGDYDEDGFPDLFVAAVGGDTLLQNLGDGTFADATDVAGVSDPHWTSGAAFADLTDDGVVDLYVCNYVDYDPRNPIACYDSAGNPGTCHPNDVAAEVNRFYAGRGDGTFREASGEFGFEAGDGKSLAVVVADLTGDGRADVYVANDVTPNHLFARRGGTFEEVAVLSGAAASELGQYQASMGVAFGDYDGDGRDDLYVTHFTSDSNTLYRQLSVGFSDQTRSEGLHTPTLALLGFGTVMSDFDADGAADLFVANGHIDDWRGTNGDPYLMRPQLFSRAGGTWRDVADDGGPYFSGEYLGRAVAAADYDRDGDTDLAVVHQNAPAAVLQNVSGGGHWLRVRPVGVRSPRVPIGTIVRVVSGGREHHRQLAAGTSYAASHEASLHFGLGRRGDPVSVRIRWPGGTEERYEGVPADRSFTAVEGLGRPVYERRPAAEAARESSES